MSHPEGCTPKMIASATSINVNTVKSILAKMQNLKILARGLYVVDLGGDGGSTSDGTISSWNFHNLILSCRLQDFKVIEEEFGFDLVNFKIQISEDGNCTCVVSTDYPMNVSSICVVYGYLKEILGRYSKDQISMAKIQVRCMEFNKDYANMKFEGINCITMDGLCTQFKLYQKELALRKEHKTKVHFNVGNMVDMLTGSPASLDLSVKLREQTDLLDKLTRQSVFNTAQLSKLLEVMK